MPPTFVLPRFFPLDSIKLGRFITDIDNPHQNYHDPAWSPPLKSVSSSLAYYKATHKTAASSGFAAELTSLLSARVSKRAEVDLDVEAESTETLTIDNTAARFREALGLPDTQAWLEREIDQGEKIFMVVGLQAMRDARVTQRSSRGKAVQGRVQAPVEAIVLASTGVAVPLGGVLDPGIEVERQAGDEKLSGFLVHGNQVCALQLCRVKHAWFASKSVDKTQLSGKPWWKSQDSWRDEGVRGEEEQDEEDCVECELVDPEADELGPGFLLGYSQDIHNSELE